MTDLPGEPPNLALTRPLPSTSSENLPRESPWVTATECVPGATRSGGMAEAAPGGRGLGFRRVAVTEQAQLWQACGRGSVSEHSGMQSLPVPASVSAVSRGCRWVGGVGGCMRLVPPGLLEGNTGDSVCGPEASCWLWGPRGFVAF